MMSKGIMNPEMCSGILWWKNKRRKIYLRSSISMTFIAGVFGFLFVLGSDTIAAKELVFIIALPSMFAFVAINQFIHYLRLPLIQIEKCWYGQIVGTRRAINRRKKARAYYIIADISGKELEGRCLYETYLRAEIGDEVVIFTHGRNGVCCVHRDMP